MSGTLLSFSLTVFTGFFAIMNPIANAPIFVGLVGDQDKLTQKKVAKKACLVAFFIELSFLILGKYIFEIFGITMPAFKITGGVLLFYIGFEMLNSSKSNVHSNKDVEVDIEGTAVSPLAIPILAGPGTIVTGMNFVSNVSYFKAGIVLVIFTIMILITYYAFITSEKIEKWFGKNLIAVISKLMGLILAIIGVEMLVTGIKLAFNIQ
jgi:multiple antibiotic resistance protein